MVSGKCILRVLAEPVNATKRDNNFTEILEFKLGPER